MRLRRLEEEYAGRVELDWRSYLLRPEPRVSRDRARAMEKFRRYTESWRVPAADADAGEFRVWQSDEGPPSHSVPAHLVAKAAARQGKEAFRRMHERLLRAYFSESRDISDDETLRALWLEVGLDPGAFESRNDPELLRAVLSEHREALEAGATGVPAMRLADNPAVVVGAHPVELYRRWFDRSLEGRTTARAE